MPHCLLGSRATLAGSGLSVRLAASSASQYILIFCVSNWCWDSRYNSEALAIAGIWGWGDVSRRRERRERGRQITPNGRLGWENGEINVKCISRNRDKAKGQS